MKKNIYILFGLLLLGLVLQGCNDSDDDKGKVVNLSLKNVVRESASVMSITIKDNATPIQLVPFAMPTNAQNKEVTYKAVLGGIFNVTDEGILSPLKIGIDTLIVRTTDGSGVYVKYPVKVITHIIPIVSINIASSANPLQIEKGTTVDFSKNVVVNPADATNKALIYSIKDTDIATVDPQTGVITAIEIGKTTLTIQATDGSQVESSAEIIVVDRVTGPKEYEREGWSIKEISQPYQPDISTVLTTGMPEHLLDGETITYLSLAKPGEFDTPVGATVFFVLDMGKEQEIGYVRLSYRTSNASANLRVITGTFYGSANGTDFTQIGEAARSFNVGVADNQFEFEEADVAKYRYIKFTYDSWHASGKTMQLSEVNVGYIIK